MMLVASTAFAQSTVYLTRDISPESLVKIYKALGVPAKGRVAVKMSTGEGSNPNYLKPELVKNLIFEVDGTIVECNTAYSSGPGNEKDDRNSSANHWQVIERHGFTKFFPVDTDYRFAQVINVPATHKFIKGDTIVTSGLSPDFPEGIVVGYVVDGENLSGSGFYKMQIRLATDFNKLDHVYVIKNHFRDEQKELMDRTVQKDEKGRK